MKRIAVEEVDGSICVDFLLSPKKSEGKCRVTKPMQKVMRALFQEGARQSHNKTPKNTFRLLTEFSTKNEVVRFIKRHGGLLAVRLVQVS